MKALTMLWNLICWREDSDKGQQNKGQGIGKLLEIAWIAFHFIFHELNIALVVNLVNLHGYGFRLVARIFWSFMGVQVLSYCKTSCQHIIGQISISVTKSSIPLNNEWYILSLLQVCRTKPLAPRCLPSSHYLWKMCLRRSENMHQHTVIQIIKIWYGLFLR